MWAGLADDTTLFFESFEDMQAAMNILVDIFDRCRLILKEGKTETMFFDPDIDAESDYPKKFHRNQWIPDQKCTEIPVFRQPHKVQRGKHWRA